MSLRIATRARGAMGGVESYLRGAAPPLIERGHQVALLYEHHGEEATDGDDPDVACAAEWSVEAQGEAAALAEPAQWQRLREQALAPRLDQRERHLAAARLRPEQSGRLLPAPCCYSGAGLPGIEAPALSDQRRGPQSACALGWQRERPESGVEYPLAEAAA